MPVCCAARVSVPSVCHAPSSIIARPFGTLAGIAYSRPSGRATADAAVAGLLCSGWTVQSCRPRLHATTTTRNSALCAATAIWQPALDVAALARCYAFWLGAASGALIPLRSRLADHTPTPVPVLAPDTYPGAPLLVGIVGLAERAGACNVPALFGNRVPCGAGRTLATEVLAFAPAGT